jgi:hypothetical protein
VQARAITLFAGMGNAERFRTREEAIVRKNEFEVESLNQSDCTRLRRTRLTDDQLEPVGRVDPRRGALEGAGVQKTLTLVTHQPFQELPVRVFDLFLEVFEEELFGLLQSLPALGRFDDEGFAGSHGCIAFHEVEGFHLVLNPDTPASRFYTLFSTAP